MLILGTALGIERHVKVGLCSQETQSLLRVQICRFSVTQCCPWYRIALFFLLVLDRTSIYPTAQDKNLKHPKFNSSIFLTPLYIIHQQILSVLSPKLPQDPFTSCITPIMVTQWLSLGKYSPLAGVFWQCQDILGCHDGRQIYWHLVASSRGQSCC